ncbi:MAG: fadD-2 [Syntrophaceae bacterium]|nr:MAG: fadD-2 [Syntrophaceae bacterium]
MPSKVIVVKDRRWFRCWPRLLPKSLDYPEVPVFETLEVTAKRYPHKATVIYYGSEITYQALWDSSLKLASYLKDIGIQKGDRVAIHLPNTPHAVIAYYGILRANAIVVSIDPMVSADGLKALLNDSGSKAILTMASSLAMINGIRSETSLQKVVACQYEDYLPEKPALPVPAQMLTPAEIDTSAQSWKDVMGVSIDPPAIKVGPDDNALIMYTSGTTGERKGALHTHWNLIVNTLRAAAWNYNYSSSVHLTVLPLFHITGMHYCMTAPVYTGGTIVLLSRWDREAALEAIEKYSCTHFSNITTIVVDLLSVPDIDKRNLSSLIVFGGGGAAVPDAVGNKLAAMGLLYTEGYGLTEAGSGTHVNPRDRVTVKCVGLPLFDIDSMIINPETLQEMPIGQSGELLMRSPSMFKEFWNKPKETAQAFVEINGVKWFRTGDIVRMDEDGNHYFVDRLKRLVNRAGLKVWPAAIEGEYYKHPAIKEACIIGTADERVGEEVKVCVVLNQSYQGKITEKEMLAWGKERFAAYEYPRIVEFVNELPKNASGKIQWKLLQEQENAKKKQ